MLRPCGRACHRTFTSINHPVLPTPPRLNLQTNNLLGEVGALATRGQLNEALSLFYALQTHCNQTYATLFHACARHYSLQQGLSLHHYMVAHNPITPPDLFVSNHLINMYAKFGYLDHAHQLFDEMPRRNLVTWTALISGDEACKVFRSMESRNLISWNSMIAGFQCRGRGAQAIDLFVQMHLDGLEFDRATLLSVLSSLNGVNDIDDVVVTKFCYQLHCLVIKTGFILGIEVVTALVKAYSDLGGDAADCYRLFSETSCHRDIVAWTGIMTIFSERDPEEALSLFRQLRRENLAPDRYTFSIVLKAYASLATERHASAVHSQVIKGGFGGDTVLANALIHAYARCGSISSSKQIFDGIEFRDVVSWNTMLKAYALYGQAAEALQLFSQMDVKPDSATFVSLCACSHAGLVEEGTRIFDSMLERYGIVPLCDHYACMVDILGRAGRVGEAEKLVSRMPMEPDSVVWSALLGSCRKHGNTQLAKWSWLQRVH
ncbi:putative pentatricopeptide [Rosa chinensis]|uniref:Putative pentatricopeptide n=1 Tax=Rosa chinensis TaxID=74649 RepID=A0A2P6PKL7_ROSCH|nr:putative pentatricopeptide [Rosa chinensis]